MSSEEVAIEVDRIFSEVRTSLGFRVPGLGFRGGGDRGGPHLFRGKDEIIYPVGRLSQQTVVYFINTLQIEGLSLSAHHGFSITPHHICRMQFRV